MATSLAFNWWAIVLRGVLAVLLGALTLVLPGITLLALILLFGSYSLLEGVLNIVAAVRGMRRETRWGALLIEGIVSILAGIVAFAWPGLTSLALLYLIAFWALATGAFEIAAALRLRRIIHDEWLLALSGVASLALGVLLVMAPGPGALAVVLWLGAYMIVFGALLIGLGVRVHSWASHPTEMPHLEGM